MAGVLAPAGLLFYFFFSPIRALAAEASEDGSGIHVVLKAEQVGSLFGLPITNSLLMTWLVIGLFAIFTVFFRKSLAQIPGKLQAGIEWMFEGLLSYMTATFESEHYAKRYFPLVMTIFLFVLTSNLLAFMPGIGSVVVAGEHGLVPLLRAPAADLNFTLALAFISFFVIEIAGLAALGTWKYAGKYINLKSPVGFLVGIIEFISNLSRLISLSFRLFGNIFAGEVMLMVAGFFFAYFLPIPLLAFEVFVAFIQALVFALLTLIFIKLSIIEPHGEAH